MTQEIHLTGRVGRLATQLSAAEDRYEIARKAAVPNVETVARLLKKCQEIELTLDEAIAERLQAIANA